MPSLRLGLSAVALILFLASFAFSPGTSAAAPSPSDEDFARASRAVDANCPSLGHRLLELFGIVAESAGTGLIAIFETPSALLDYLVTEPKTTRESQHPYYPTTEEYAADVRLRYQALVEGVETPACLRAVCDVERLKSADGEPVSAACTRGAARR